MTEGGCASSNLQMEHIVMLGTILVNNLSGKIALGYKYWH
jgi:hypothetical protein